MSTPIYTKEMVDDLDSYFKENTLPKGQFQLTSYIAIDNVQRFVHAHMVDLKSERTNNMSFRLLSHLKKYMENAIKINNRGNQHH